MTGRPLVNADDLGLTRQINRDVLRAVDAGAINGVSLMVTGQDVAYAVSAVRERPELDVGLHLDLLEGRAIARAEKVPDLVGRDGYFRRGFTGLWIQGSSGIGKARKALGEQIRREVGAQLDTFQEAFPDCRGIRVDGHLHVHVLPVVLDALLENAEARNIDRIRLPVEPLRWPASASMNGVKQLVLGCLSIAARRKLRSANISYPGYFVGVAYSGRMFQFPIERYIQKCSSPSAEILFHPGRALDSEIDGLRFKEFHQSSNRNKELEGLLGGSTRELLGEKSLIER